MCRRRVLLRLKMGFWEKRQDRMAKVDKRVKRGWRRVPLLLVCLWGQLRKPCKTQIERVSRAGMSVLVGEKRRRVID